ncbi:MAG: hypothetical protein ACYC7E_13240 [Armatimonadota bacterium]
MLFYATVLPFVVQNSHHLAHDQTGEEPDTGPVYVVRMTRADRKPALIAQVRRLQAGGGGNLPSFFTRDVRTTAKPLLIEKGFESLPVYQN